MSLFFFWWKPSEQIGIFHVHSDSPYLWRKSFQISSGFFQKKFSRKIFRFKKKWKKDFFKKYCLENKRGFFLLKKFLKSFYWNFILRTCHFHLQLFKKVKKFRAKFSMKKNGWDSQISLRGLHLKFFKPFVYHHKNKKEYWFSVFLRRWNSFTKKDSSSKKKLSHNKKAKSLSQSQFFHISKFSFSPKIFFCLSTPLTKKKYN